jgi:hypothetical protein
MHQAEFEQHIGAGNICPSIADALERAGVLNAEIERQGLQIASGATRPDGLR